MLFHCRLIHAGPSTQSLNILKQKLWGFEGSWYLGVVLDPPFWSGIDVEANSWKHPWNIVHSTPCRSLCRFSLPFKFPWSCGLPSSGTKWSGTISNFPPTRMLNYNGHKALNYSIKCTQELRPPLQMDQEPWPWKPKDHWKSSKGHTVGNKNKNCHWWTLKLKVKVDHIEGLQQIVWSIQNSR